MTTRRLAAVAAGSKTAADAAEAVLAEGGNAMDAAIAAAAAAGVAEPGLTSLGGGGFAVVRLASGQEVVCDFFVDAPGRGGGDVTAHFTPVTIEFSGARQQFHAGWGSVAVPGCLAGYLHLHRLWGRLPMADVLAPAVLAARRGVPVEPAQRQVIGLLRGIFALSQEGRALIQPIAPDAPSPQEKLRNPALADFLESIAAGRVASFADEPVCSLLVDAMATHGGLVTRDDLAAYQPQLRPPLRTTWGDAALATNPAPSVGGSILLNTLARLAPPVDSGTAMDPVAVLTALAAATTDHKARGDASPVATKGTTHISVVDADALTVSLTTSNGSCSGMFVPTTGVQLNNIMGEEDLHPTGFHTLPPGTRVGSMMTPTVIELPDGSVVALGSGGSERIRSAIAHTVSRIVAGQSLADAVGAPRLHWDGEQVQAEPGLRLPTDVPGLGPVHAWRDRDFYFGGVQAVLRRPDGSVEAVGDPRRGGVGRVVVTP